MAVGRNDGIRWQADGARSAQTSAGSRRSSSSSSVPSDFFELAPTTSNAGLPLRLPRATLPSHWQPGTLNAISRSAESLRSVSSSEHGADSVHPRQAALVDMDDFYCADCEHSADLPPSPPPKEPLQHEIKPPRLCHFNMRMSLGMNVSLYHLKSDRFAPQKLVLLPKSRFGTYVNAVCRTAKELRKDIPKLQQQVAKLEQACKPIPDKLQQKLDLATDKYLLLERVACDLREIADMKVRAKKWQATCCSDGAEEFREKLDRTFLDASLANWIANCDDPLFCNRWANSVYAQYVAYTISGQRDENNQLIIPINLGPCENKYQNYQKALKPKRDEFRHRRVFYVDENGQRTGQAILNMVPRQVLYDPNQRPAAPVSSWPPTPFWDQQVAPQPLAPQSPEPQLPARPRLPLPRREPAEPRSHSSMSCDSQLSDANLRQLSSESSEERVRRLLGPNYPAPQGREQPAPRYGDRRPRPIEDDRRSSSSVSDDYASEHRGRRNSCSTRSSAHSYIYDDHDINRRHRAQAPRYQPRRERADPNRPHREGRNNHQRHHRHRHQ